MEELNKKLAEWAGFEYIEYQMCECHPDRIGKYWRKPIGGWHSNDTPIFTDSIDTCFKWLVPKLGEILIQLDNYRGDWVCTIVTNRIKYYAACANTQSLALCLTIEKLIEDKSIEKDRT